MGRAAVGAGPGLVLAAAVLWGTTGTAQDFAPDGASSTGIGAMRLLVGGAALVLLAGVRRRLPGTRLFGPPLLAAAAAMAVYQPLFFSGVARTGVAVGTIAAIGSAPVIAGALAYVALGERPGPRWAGATVLAVAGAALLVAGGDDLGVDAAGLTMAIGAGAAYAAYAVASKELVSDHDPVGVMAAVFALAALLLSPYLVVEGAGWAASTSGALVALHLGVVATALAYVLFAAGLRRIPVATTTTLTLAEPLTAAMLGVAVVGETITVGAAAGAGLLLAGLAMLAVRRREPAPAPVS